MAQVEEYWRRRKVLAFVGLTFILSFFFLVAFLGAAAASVWPRLTEYWNVSNESDRLYLLATIANLALTFALLIATSIYALLTRLTLNELVEARRSSKRPVLITSFGEFTLTTGRRGERYVMTALTVHNYGPAVAIGLRGGATLLRKPLLERPTGDERVQNLFSVGKGKDILPGATEQFEIVTPIEYEPAEGRHRAFAELRLKFEDVERNLYTLEQEFSLYRHGPDAATWSISYDALYLTPNRSRSDVADTEIGREMVGKRRFLVYERSGLRI